MAGFSNKSWSCPFFKWDEPQAVRCEGGRLAFPDRQTTRDFTGRYCAGERGWKYCGIARVLELYYERG